MEVQELKKSPLGYIKNYYKYKMHRHVEEKKVMDAYHKSTRYIEGHG